MTQEEQTMITLQNLNYPPSYFEDEVREGFFVSGMMKRCWAAQLKVLSEIDRICKKHDIGWFLMFGALLGAVRHRGFIPWDDDLDICMLREDLERFLDYAEQELPAGYTIGDVRRRSDYLNANMRITNTEVITDSNTRSFFGFPYFAGVDIFALDGVFRNEEKEQKRRADIREIQELCTIMEEGTAEEAFLNKKKKLLEEKYGPAFTPGGNDLNAALRLLIPLFSACSVQDTEEIMIYLNGVDDYRMKKEWFAQSVPVSFENLSLPAPVGYPEILLCRYHNFFYTARGGAYHEYPYYENVDAFYASRLGHNPFRYTLEKHA